MSAKHVPRFSFANVSERHAAAQATVEFILTIVVALLLISAVILPSYENSSSYVQDVANLSKLRVSADKLVDAIQYAWVSGKGTKQTLEVVVPSLGLIECTPSGTNSDTITMTYSLLSQSIGACQVDADPDNGRSCKKDLPAGGAFFGCNPSNLTQGIYIVTVSKHQDTGAVEVTGTKVG